MDRAPEGKSQSAGVESKRQAPRLESKGTDGEGALAEMNFPMAVTVAQEYCMPAYTQDGGTAVAFFNRHEMIFCIPCANEAETVALAARFQDLIVRAMDRYEMLGGYAFASAKGPNPLQMKKLGVQAEATVEQSLKNVQALSTQETDEDTAKRTEESNSTHRR